MERPEIWLLLAAMVAGLVTWVVVARRRASACRAMERGLRAIAEGRVPKRSRGRFAGWFGKLVRTFNAVAPELVEGRRRLEADSRLLRAMLQGMGEGVIAVDDRRRLLFANRAAERIFDLAPDAIGRLVAERLRSPQVQQAIERTIGGGSSYETEFTSQAPADLLRGGLVHLHVHGTPMPGRPTPGALLVVHDVTDLRRLERMRQDFVANASHELKTPLASIKALAETLLDGALYDEAVNSKFLKQIDEQTDRLHRLILDMLSLARLESGEGGFQHRPLTIRPVLTRIVESHRDRAVAQGLDYRADFNGLEATVRVLADEEAIRQIGDNLIDNAINYTSEGGSIQVVARSTSSSVEVEVRDTGIGIPREDIPRVFERFYRVDKARSREVGGTGLGLSIVKHLAQGLGGQVDLVSRPGQGSTFLVRLPRCGEAGESPSASSQFRGS